MEVLQIRAHEGPRVHQREAHVQQGFAAEYGGRALRVYEEGSKLDSSRNRVIHCILYNNIYNNSMQRESAALTRLVVC